VALHQHQQSIIGNTATDNQSKAGRSAKQKRRLTMPWHYAIKHIQLFQMLRGSTKDYVPK